MSNKLLVLAFLMALAPTTANSISIFPASSKGGSLLVAGPVDVTITPSPPAPGVPIPYPVTTTSAKNPVTNKTETTTKLIIKSENSRVSSGDFATTGVSKGIRSSKTVGFGGDILSFTFDVKVEDEESALFSISLADPSTGRPLGPDYSVEVTETQKGSVAFDISDFATFDIFLLAIQTTPVGLPKSKLALTDIALDGASISENFLVKVIPVPAAIWLFGSALIGLLGFSRRKAG